MTAIKHRNEIEEDKAFAEFLAKPETKFLISLIPATDNPDLVTTILHAAFNAGVGYGCTIIMTSLLHTIVEDKRKTPPGGL